MNREEKQEVVLALQEKMQEYGNFYIADDFDQYELNMHGELTQLRTGKPWEK